MQSVEEYGYEEFSFPQGVACGNKYGIYVADTWNQRIQVMSTNGLVLRSFSGSKLNSPTGVAVDDEGFIIVADTWNHRLQVLDPAGNVVSNFGKQGSEPGQACAHAPAVRRLVLTERITLQASSTVREGSAWT
eukprot:1435401-Rhodomonas_salina.1